MKSIKHSYRTRSDSNSFVLNDEEFEVSIRNLLDNDDHTVVVFNSVYVDFISKSISAVSFLNQLKSLVAEDVAYSILNLIKLNCPIELYPDIEELIKSHSYQLTDNDYNRSIKEKYSQLITSIKEIQQSCRYNMRGVSHDHVYYNNLHQIKRTCHHFIHLVEKAMNDEECGYIVNRVDEFHHHVLKLRGSYHSVMNSHSLEESYDPLFDDDIINESFKHNHQWIIHTVKHDIHGVLKRKQFVLLPRFQRLMNTQCGKDDYFMVYWKEACGSRLLYECHFIPDEKNSVVDVVPLLIRITEYCFLFHSNEPGTLVQMWSNKLSFQKKKRIHCFVHQYKSEDGIKQFKEYDEKLYEVLDQRSRYLTKCEYEGGELTVKVTTTVQKENGIHYVCSCYWKNSLLKANIVWEVTHTWEEWRELYLFLQNRYSDVVYELPPFPKTHLVLTNLLKEDRILGLDRFIQGLLSDSQIMSSYKVNRFFRISSHIHKVKSNVLCMVQKINKDSKITETITEEPEVHFSPSPNDSVLKDPLSYLVSVYICLLMVFPIFYDDLYKDENKHHLRNTISEYEA